jgi:signal transduction histidine kinase
MNWSSAHIASTVTFAGYAIWFAAVFVRRLLAPAMHMFAFTDRLRGMGLSVLLLPVLIAVNGLWGTFAHRLLLASPGIALAIWTFAPRYVISKIVPLTLVADGLYGFVRLQYLMARFTFSSQIPPRYGLNERPQFVLAESLAFIAAGIWLTWRATDPNSAAAELARALFRPFGLAGPARRVTGHTRTGADTVATTQLRRLDRDLHDRTQASLVALGVSLRTAERLFPTSPQAAIELVAEARKISVELLDELAGSDGRFGTFDGAAAVNNPGDGSTTIPIEVLCALSSPKISSFSETV